MLFGQTKRDFFFLRSLIFHDISVLLEGLLNIGGISNRTDDTLDRKDGAGRKLSWYYATVVCQRNGSSLLIELNWCIPERSCAGKYSQESKEQLQ